MHDISDQTIQVLTVAITARFGSLMLIEHERPIKIEHLASKREVLVFNPS